MQVVNKTVAIHLKDKMKQLVRKDQDSSKVQTMEMLLQLRVKHKLAELRTFKILMLVRKVFL
jgi:hypothetical protein